MTVKAKFLFCLPFTSAVLCISSCGTTQQSRFQMAFLPSTPHAALTAMDLAEPPAVANNPYLADVPPIVSAIPQLPPFTRAGSMMKRADQHFQRGRRYYQAQDAENARQ